MEIVLKKLNEIKPYENNPRNNDDAVEKVANSIKEFGFKVPIVIDKEGIIIAGHTRYKASQLLKLEEVPCIVADDLNKKQIKAFRLADNKVSELSNWNYDLLDLELKDLDLNMEEFGFINNFELNINDEDFIKDTEITRDRKKEIICPHCGEKIEI